MFVRPEGFSVAHIDYRIFWVSLRVEVFSSIAT